MRSPAHLKTTIPNAVPTCFEEACEIHGCAVSERVIDEQYDGRYECWNSNGWLEITGQHVMDERAGQWETFHSNGVVAVRVAYGPSGFEQGQAAWFFPNGQTRATGCYDNSLRVGEWTWFFSDGIECAQGGYVAGDCHGEWRYWYENGTNALRVTYDGSPYGGGDSRVLSAEAWYPTGKLRGTWIPGDEDDMLHETLYYESGNRSWDGVRWYHARVGMWQRWYPSGELQWQCRFENDSPVQISYYNKEGRRLFEGPYYRYLQKRMTDRLGCLRTPMALAVKELTLGRTFEEIEDELGCPVRVLPTGIPSRRNAYEIHFGDEQQRVKRFPEWACSYPSPRLEALNYTYFGWDTEKNCLRERRVHFSWPGMFLVCQTESRVSFD